MVSAPSPADEQRGGSARRADAAAAAGLFLLALLLYAATLPMPVFGDGVHLAHMLERGPAPYYNLAYLPSVWTFLAAFSPPAGWTTLQGMGWFSAACGAGAVALTFLALRRVDLARAPAAALSAFVALTPGTWLFSCVTEIHALQLLGISAGAWLALCARSAPPLRAVALVAAAVLASMLSHSSGLLMAPAVAALAWNGSDRRAAALRAPVGVALGLALGLALGFALAWLAREWSRRLGGPERAGLDLFTMLRIGRGALDRSSAADLWFGPGEVAQYLGDELVRPAGLLLAALPLVLRSGSAWLRLPLALALAPGLLLYPQGHIREHGAYYVSLYPFLALLAAQGMRRVRLPRGAAAGALALALVAQALLARRTLDQHRRGLGVEAWGAAVEAALAGQTAPRGVGRPVFFVDRLPRFDWLVHVRPLGSVHDALRVLDLQPRRRHPQLIDALLGIAGEKLAQGGAVYIDADLLDDPQRPSFLDAFEARLRSFPVRLDPLAAAPGEAPVLYRVLVADDAPPPR